LIDNWPSLFKYEIVCYSYVHICFLLLLFNSHFEKDVLIFTAMINAMNIIIRLSDRINTCPEKISKEVPGLNTE